MINRRAFLKGSSMALVSLGFGSLGGPGFLRRTAAATTGPGSLSKRKTLVTLFQRGAMDGLAAVTPLADRNYQKLRPTLAMTAARSEGEGALIDLGDGFGFHPALRPLEQLYRSRELGVVHAVGSHDPTRSHFDAQDYMESGTPGHKGTENGWLDRVVGELGHEASPFRAVSMTQAMPRSLYGRNGAIALSRLSDFRVGSSNRSGAAAEAGFESLYQQTQDDLLHDPLLAETGQDTFEAVKMLSSLDLENYQPARGVRYPRSPLGQALRQIAFLIKSDVGLEVAFTESGGWDTHVRQGRENGVFAQRAQDLASSIAAFWLDLGALRENVVLMTTTEFGRTVKENGTGGTDHGHASCLFVLGHQIDGGKVHGDLPQLSPRNLYEGRDLPVTTDFRSVFAEVAREHMGVADQSALFPGFSGRPLGLFRPS